MRYLLDILPAALVATLALGTAAAADPAPSDDLDAGYRALSLVDAHAADAAAETVPVAAPVRGDTEVDHVAFPELDAGYIAPSLVDARAADAAQTPARPASEPVSAALGALLDDPRWRESAHSEALVAFYGESGHAPLWIDAGRLTGSARAVVARLKRADEDGLDPARYSTPASNLGIARPAMARELAEAELKLTTAALAYARHARAGQVEPSSLGRFVSAKPAAPDPKAVLAGLADSDDRAAYLAGFNPDHPGFIALRDALAELRGQAAGTEPIVIADGPLLRPGTRDARIPDLRARLDAPPGDDPELYDAALEEAVRSYQDRHGLTVDGVVGPQTLHTLNGDRDPTVADILVNMERWRWLPPDMGGSHHVWVNIPEFRLRVISDGEVAFATRVIVGSREHQTPIFSDEIEYLEVNPYWHVPRSIALRDLIPQARRDPTTLMRRGIQVFYRSNGQSYEIDPRTIDWHTWGGSDMPFRFRQVPGNQNALGKVKFMFPNQHAVYLHDTPTRNLFERDVRIFSAGCVRVEDPIAFADALAVLEPDLDGARVERLIAGGQTGQVNLAHRVPVHLTYITVFAGESGALNLRPDVYGHDARLKAALGLIDDEMS